MALECVALERRHMSPKALPCALLLLVGLAATSAAQDRGLESSHRKSEQVKKGRDCALLFATDSYDDRAWQTLRNPVRDATTIARELSSPYGFEETRVVKNPTRQDVIKTLYEYRTQRQFADNDQLLAFFAGHGLYRRDFEIGYIVARDSRAAEIDVTNDSYVSFAELYRLINAIRSKHIFLVLDVCNGGTFPEAVMARGGQQRADYDELTVDERISRVLQRTTRKFLTSGGNEYVPDGSGAHSPFAAKFLEALRRPSRDGTITASEIYTVVRHVKPNEPRFGDFGSFEPVSDFIFLPGSAKNTTRIADTSRTASGDKGVAEPKIATPRGTSESAKPPAMPLAPGDYSGRLNGEPSIAVWLAFSHHDRAVLQYRLRWDEGDRPASSGLLQASCRPADSVLDCTTMSGRTARFHIQPSSAGIVLETESTHIVEALIPESVTGPRAYLRGYGTDVRQVSLSRVPNWISGSFEARVLQSDGGHLSYSGTASFGELTLTVDRMSGQPARSTFHAEAMRSAVGQIRYTRQLTESVLKAVVAAAAVALCECRRPISESHSVQSTAPGRMRSC